MSSSDAPLRDTGADPERIGPYRILSTLGQGGMGIVYLAEQTEPLRRNVAVKVIKAGMDTEQVLLRFEAERQALALMEHECIAKVFDGGSTASGRPYFAMEYVDGTPLTDYCDRNSLSVDERLKLFQQVCFGIQHAHQKGVIHRDLTPRNVLVTVQGDRPTPKIIDFGLARAVERRLAEQTIYTEQGILLGTPQYMSPEQASFGEIDIDTRTDVYALGCLLYELLVGEPPFSTADVMAAGIAGVHQMIREEEPSKPSTKVSTWSRAGSGSAKDRRLEPGALVRRLRGDLDWIVMRALEKDRDRRYDTPSALAEDIQRHLDDESVVAHAPTFGYRARKFVRRYRGQVIAGAALVITMLVGLFFSLHFASSERRAREDVERHLKRFHSLRNVVRLRQAKAAEMSLHPAHPSRAPGMQSWLDEFARPLVDDLPALQELFDSLAANTRARGGDGLDDDDQFLYETLLTLLPDTQSFAREVVPRVERRLAWARRISSASENHPHAGASWESTRDAIRAADGQVASPLYAASMVDLMPQTGLVPIGMNPATQLWEFYDLRTAYDPERHDRPQDIEIPRHEPDGSIPMTADLGVVFVLVPGGTSFMGATPLPDGPNYDEIARPEEGPVHAVRLAPFFLSRFEMTQAQWTRLEGRNPSEHPAGMDTPHGAIDLTHPVENVDWKDCFNAMLKAGLVLPTEAQWEYACRASRDTAWWTGDRAESLLAQTPAANFADASANRAGVLWGRDAAASAQDGFAYHAPVGALSANPWGLHAMHGNVAEWCFDRPSSYQTSIPGPLDGLRTGAIDQDDEHARRGGSFMDASADTRAAARSFGFVRHPSTGVRPARPLDW